MFLNINMYFSLYPIISTSFSYALKVIFLDKLRLKYHDVFLDKFNITILLPDVYSTSIHMTQD